MRNQKNKRDPLLLESEPEAQLPKMLIPMIRRTFPELITHEIVNVQPMTGPVGMPFAMTYKYEEPDKLIIG